MAVYGGGSCLITGSLSVLESMRHGKVRAVAAGATQRTVVVGLASVTLAAGQSTTMTVTLNKVGKRLLAHHHRLRVTLTITQNGTTVSRSTIALGVTKHQKKRRGPGTRIRSRSRGT